MRGWTGSILRINLTTGVYIIEDLPFPLLRDFIGGRGLGAALLYREINAKCDPLSPENKMFLVTGPLTGIAPMGARYMAVTKSPLTGAITCSNSGGHFAPELKFAGYDGIVLEGKSCEPVYIWIQDGDVEIRKAQHLWGKNTSETEDLIRAENEDPYIGRDFQVICIGPAGENQVRIAGAVTNKGRIAARSGVGAVMGSKNLKAIAVRGTKAINLADVKDFRGSLEAVLEKVKSSIFIGQTGTLRVYGTPIGTYGNNRLGCMPVRNYQGSILPDAKKLDGRTVIKNVVAHTGCFGCPTSCGIITRVSDPEYPEFDAYGKGPEFETIHTLGTACGIDNYAAIFKAHRLCAELGMDAISMGNIIGLAMELYERGFLPKNDVGFELGFGDIDAMLKLVEMTGRREGFGNALAEGGYRMAARYGHPELFVGVKKQEGSIHNVRAIKGMGLEWATSNRGACHERASMFNLEAWGVPEKLDPLVEEGKATWLKKLQDDRAIIDSCGLCEFLMYGADFEDIRRMLVAATGVDYTADSLIQAGERIWNIERLFNLAAGFTKNDDTLPKRMTEEPIPDGPAQGHVVNLDKMLPEYYHVRGWHKNGRPSPKKLTELGLSG